MNRNLDDIDYIDCRQKSSLTSVVFTISYLLPFDSSVLTHFVVCCDFDLQPLPLTTRNVVWHELLGIEVNGRMRNVIKGNGCIVLSNIKHRRINKHHERNPLGNIKYFYDLFTFPFLPAFVTLSIIWLRLVNINKLRNKPGKRSEM